MNGSSPGLALIERLRLTRKWDKCLSGITRSSWITHYHTVFAYTGSEVTCYLRVSSRSFPRFELVALF